MYLYFEKLRSQGRYKEWTLKISIYVTRSYNFDVAREHILLSCLRCDEFINIKYWLVLFFLNCRASSKETLNRRTFFPSYIFLPGWESYIASDGNPVQLYPISIWTASEANANKRSDCFGEKTSSLKNGPLVFDESEDEKYS